mmetsp:Transcript_38656/g.74116  ORF Transcript_38656/g.74116 Transcript_38656/m.74116 type:complete len:232 (-) Transcript_38656:620-1315(-)
MRCSSTPAIIWYLKLLEVAMYAPYVRLLRTRGSLVPSSSGGATMESATTVGCSFRRTISKLFVIPMPSRLAPHPTTKSLLPLTRTTAPRCATVNLRRDPATWNAFFGHASRKRCRRPARLVPSTARNGRVGAGSHTRQKSATMAIIRSANTKSISWKKLDLRFSHSAAVFVTTPIPHSIATLVRNNGSARRRSSMPVKGNASRAKIFSSSATNMLIVLNGTHPILRACAKA